MNALLSIETELRQLGYASEAIIRDYTFADVLSATGESRRVDLAAFTQVPESYRSAAFGVVVGEDEISLIDRRALGAPILFSIGRQDIGVWRVVAKGAPRLIERVSLDAIPELFRRNAERWRPQAVHRAKALGQAQTAYQLDFVDLGLLPAIEHEVEGKLDRLLRQVVEELMAGLDGETEEAVFRTTFRLLAAKILLDREHPAAVMWRDASVTKVLAGIESYYGLGRLPSEALSGVPYPSLETAWRTLSRAISFRNISSDSLAFVYENTLVTKDTRRRFGTHSTPRQVAEYVVGRLDLSNFDLDGLTVFEPFTGAGAFLVAALRHMRDLLPEGLSAEERHAFLVPRIRGAEIDAFACEVATLSLILADYPNANGWKISNEDLFRPAVLAQQIGSARIMLCNPPWEDFEAEKRAEYPEMATKSFSKPMAVLRTVLEATPDGIGFVLPQGFLRQQQYSQIRQMIADRYQRVELTSLPDRIFQRAGFEAAVLIASDRRVDLEQRTVHLVSSVVSDRGRADFLATGKLTTERRRTKDIYSGDLWIGELDELWETIERFPRLGEMADVYRGLKWWQQGSGVSEAPLMGFAPGVFKPADSLLQYCVRNTVYLNMHPDAAMFPGPLSRPWDRPKVLTNAARLSRGPWRMAAASDLSGLVASQGFFGIWPTSDKLPLEALEAILNGPLANAFLTERASNQHFTNELLKLLPMPKKALNRVVEAVKRYRAAGGAAGAETLRAADTAEILNRLLIEIDAEVLRAYDLPPRLERRLLEFFRGHERERRVDHPFQGWLPEDFTAYMPLHEFLGPLVESNRGSWALEAFTPAPEEEAGILRQYIH
ncbi:N-6 DNA methylase [Falsiroseomonas selenitidurans]|uniref:site-specific DNA-methyltransferase (adenine-specific) n=1 Tax=Falsiroseomonas selenitidurans TaxID=2716335 RepID=A0ABX1E387_9PROT|nr:N-6 DNA methylase [Falsiroseomonas selenitidurans]NKC31640.1 SAM-dependent DNA methyltransferase [Falsiroseomonas selenitidurans]